MKIQVTIKTVYGNENIYPACDKSKLFAKLTKKKTLSQADIAVIKELGYTIEVIQEAKTL